MIWKSDLVFRSDPITICTIFSVFSALCRANVGRVFISWFGLPNIQMFLQPNLMISSRRRRGWHWTSWTHWELPKHHTKKVWPLKKGLGLWYHFCHFSNSRYDIIFIKKSCKKLEVEYLKVKYFLRQNWSLCFFLYKSFLRQSSWWWAGQFLNFQLTGWRQICNFGWPCCLLVLVSKSLVVLGL